LTPEVTLWTKTKFFGSALTNSPAHSNAVSDKFLKFKLIKLSGLASTQALKWAWVCSTKRGIEPKEPWFNGVEVEERKKCGLKALPNGGGG